MPRKPKQPCGYPGCPRLCDGRYCEEHRKLEAKRYEMYSRDPSVHRKYGRAWKRIRDSYVKEPPFCEQCFERGILVPVAEVHHKVPVSKGGTHERSNLMSLCRSCHNKIHAELGDRNARNCLGGAFSDETFALLMGEATKYISFPYVWGGSSPSTSFDCSGFVCWSYTKSGVYNLPRTTAQGVYNKCVPISKSEAKPRDLVFFTGKYQSSNLVTHIGI